VGGTVEGWAGAALGAVAMKRIRGSASSGGADIGASLRRAATGVQRTGAGLLAFLLFFAVPVYANYCATPGRDSTAASVSGVVNTYYPATADVGSGGSSANITIGAATGAMQPIAIGDLLLVIQMQDATIDTGNNSGYGDNVNGAPASGYTSIAQAGRYEFVRATTAVGIGGGTVNVVSATGTGLTYAYNHNAANSSTQKQSFQVVKVPQYVDATISGTVTASPWNGTSGGIVAIDVAGRLTFAGGTILASDMGFRGGGARQLSGGAGSDTDYRTLATINNNAAKGEGISGTPRYVNNNGSLLNTGVEGYPNGSNGRGAPGNAGGGGTDGNPAANDQNTGGGGGGNGGAGGYGGYAWCPTPTGPNGCDQSGGHPGAAVAERGVSRLVMGGGGGAATTNNGSGSPGSGFASSGAAGGGIVFVRAGEIAGTGTITASGGNGNSTVLNDGTGGGGAGGSVLVSSIRSVAGASLTITANGGNGGSNTGGGSPHGPGGGGGGGYILRTATVAGSNSVLGGNPGTTAAGSTFGVNYGATAGSSGTAASTTAASIPGLSSGGECTPTITKSFATAPITPGATSRMSIAVVNNNPTLSMTSLAFTDSYPSGMVNTATPATARSCGSGTLTAAANGSSFVLASGTIAAAGNCTYSVNTTANSSGNKTNTLGVGGFTWNYGTYSQSSLWAVSAILSVAPPLTIVKASAPYFDPYNGTTNPKLIPGSYVAYAVTVANPGSYTVDNNTIIVIDATPANLQLYVSNIPGGTGPVLFQNGVPSSGLTYTFTSLASTTDDVEFSNNGGSTWTYVPTPNAFLVDPNVTHIRIRPKGTMAAGSSFNLLFGYMVAQ
jgi:hypothetical protein